MELNITSILLGLFTLLGSCVWFYDFHRNRQQAKGLKKDNKQKDMDLSKMFVDEFRNHIVEPLQHEVKMLRNAIQRIDRCPHRANCPVLDGLQHEPKDDGTEPKPKDGGHDRHTA